MLNKVNYFFALIHNTEIVLGGMEGAKVASASAWADTKEQNAQNAKKDAWSIFYQPGIFPFKRDF